MPDVMMIFDEIITEFRAARDAEQAFNQRQRAKAEFIVNTLRNRMVQIADVANERLKLIGYELYIESSFGQDAPAGAYCAVNLFRGGRFEAHQAGNLWIQLQRDGRITVKPHPGQMETEEISAEADEEDIAYLLAEFVRAALPMPFRPS